MGISFRRLGLSALLVPVSIALQGCHATYQPTPSSKPFEVPWTTSELLEQLLSELERQAEFDLKCDRRSLTFVQLHAGKYMPVGVEGCGKQATYVRLYSGAWVMNATAADVEE